MMDAARQETASTALNAAKSIRRSMAHEALSLTRNASMSACDECSPSTDRVRRAAFSLSRSPIPGEGDIVLRRVDGRLRAGQKAENLAGFTSTAVKLKRNLRVGIAQCDKVNAFYRPRDSSITICLELIEVIMTLGIRRGVPKTVQGVKFLTGVMNDQRVYSIVCWSYGAKPKESAKAVRMFNLPPERQNPAVTGPSPYFTPYFFLTLKIFS
jgi:hypothetical protein